MVGFGANGSAVDPKATVYYDFRLVMNTIFNALFQFNMGSMNNAPFGCALKQLT